MRHETELTASRMLAAVTGRAGFGRAAVLVFLLAGSTSVSAQQSTEYRGTQEQQVACTGDVFKLCWSEIPNVSRIVGCLQRERPRLSVGCRAVFDQNQNTRIAAARWQHRNHRLASASDRLQPVQYEHRSEVAAVAPIEVAVANPSIGTGATVLSPQRATEHRSKTAMHKGKKGRIGRYLAARSLHASHCGISDAGNRHHHLMAKLKNRCFKRTLAGVRLRSRMGS